MTDDHDPEHPEPPNAGREQEIARRKLLRLATFVVPAVVSTLSVGARAAAPTCTPTKGCNPSGNCMPNVCLPRYCVPSRGCIPDRPCLPVLCLPDRL